MRHRTLITALAVATIFAVTLEAQATEPGATFQNGICWEADGTEGFAMPDGECVTPADYDAMFSYEILAETPIGSQWDQTPYAGQSVAEVYDLAPEPVASERILGVGVSEPFTFVEAVRAAHLPYPA